MADKDHGAKERMKPREVVSLVLSIFAVSLSVLTGYLNFLHYEDNLSVIFQPQTYPHRADDTTLTISPQAENVIFVNSGTRPAVILWVELMYVQIRPGKSCSSYTWGKWPMFATDVKPLIVKPKDIVTQSLSINRPPSFQTKEGVVTAKGNGYAFAVAEENRSKEYIDMDICIEVHFATPSLDHGSRIVSTFKHQVTRTGIFYGGDPRLDDKEDYRPRLLIRQVGTIFN